MRLNWKYFVMRTINAVVILFIVVMIISLFLGVTYQREKMVGSRKYVDFKTDQNYHQLANMSIEEREEWAAAKREDFRVGDYNPNGSFNFIRAREVYSSSILTESFDQAVDVISLEFGKSSIVNVRMNSGEVTTDVISVIMFFLPRTVLLFATSIAICIPLSVYIGAKTAMHEGNKLGKVLSFLNMIGSSIPIWWGAYIGLIIFAFYLGWVSFSPLPFPRAEGIWYYVEVFKKMAFPIAIIVLIKLNHNAWITRSLVSDGLNEDYVEAGRAKGLPEKVIVNKHVLRNSAPPIISKSMQMVIGIIPELIIFESIIGWPGIGLLFFKALNLGGGESVILDINLIVGLAFFIALLMVILYWLSDVLYGLADPRIRVDGE